MSTEDVKKQLPTITDAPRLDGFAGFTDEVEGGEEQVSGRGPPVKFSNAAEWLYNEEPLPKGEYLVPDVERVVVCWQDDMPDPDKTRTLGPKEPWPDVDALNDAVPKEDWREGPDGHMHGPYQRQYIVHLLHMDKMTRYWWPTSTIGGGMCVRALVEATSWKRMFYGPNTYAIVEPTSTLMRTRFGNRQRPHLEIVRFTTIGPDDKALPAPEPSAKQITDDSIPF
jgi:hypothetical protein